MIWQKGTIVSGAPGGRVNVDASGLDELRFLSPKFVLNDGSDYGLVGYGLDVSDRTDFVALPAWKANGSVGAVTTGTTVSGPLPTYAAGDILTALLICRGSSTAFTMPAGWEEAGQLTVSGNQFALFWRRATASESAPTVTNAGRTSTNLLSAQLTSWSGCGTTGTPFEGLVSNSSASGVLTGADVTATGRRLAVQLWVRGANTASAPDGEWAERLDQGTGGGGACRYMADTATVEYAGTMPACSRGSSAQLYAMFGLAFIGVGSDLAASPNTLRRGLWVWDSITTVLGVTNEENILLNECVNSGITDLYLYSPLASFSTDAADFRSFIARATALDIRCWGMDGFRGWFSDGDGPQELYDTIDAMIAYNAASAADERFAGFHIDQEPADLDTFTAFHNGVASSALSAVAASGDWQDTEVLDREYLMRDWVEIHAECRSRLNAAGALLGTALPTWFDDYFGEPVTCTYGGTTQNVFLHLAANADDLVIMNYNTNPLSQISRIGYELPASLAALSTAIETHTGPGTGVSYADTVGKQTKAAALADLATVRARYSDYPRFFGDAIHDWEGWKALSPTSADTSDPLA